MNKKKLIIFVVLFIIISLIVTIFSYSFFKDPSVLLNDNSSDNVHIILYACLSFIQILFPIIPGEPLELAAGYLFGKINGTLICFVCEAIGSIILILIIKKLKNRFTSINYEEKHFKKLDKLKQTKYFPLFSLIYIMPGTPKDLLCYFAGLSNYELVPTLLVVSIGRIPSIITSTISAGFLKEKKIFISIIIYAVTVLICLIDLLIYKKIISNKEKN